MLECISISIIFVHLNIYFIKKQLLNKNIYFSILYLTFNNTIKFKYIKLARVYNVKYIYTSIGK